MQRSGSYRQGDLILKQSLDRLFNELKDKEGEQIDLDTFIDILNLIDAERKYVFNVFEQLRVDFIEDEEGSLLGRFTNGLVICENLLGDWISLKRMKEGGCYKESAHYLLRHLGIENALSYIYHIQKYDLPGAWNLSHRGLIHGYDDLVCYANLFLSCFDSPSLFFFLQEWEKNQDGKVSIRRGAKKRIGDYQTAVEKSTFVPVLISQAIVVEKVSAGSLILDALFRREARKIKEAKVHLERIKNFLLCKAEPLKDLEAITRLEENGPGFSQILFYLKGKKIEYSIKGNLISFASSNKSILIMLPLSRAFYFNRPFSLNEYRELERDGYSRFMLSSLPNSLEEIHERIQESAAVMDLRESIVFCDNFYLQRLDYAAVKKGFVNYVAGMYRIEKKEATKVYEFLKEKIEPEDLALFYAAADIILTTCVTKGEIDWQTLRIIVTSALIIRIAKYLKKKKD